MVLKETRRLPRRRQEECSYIPTLFAVVYLAGCVPESVPESRAGGKEPRAVSQISSTQGSRSLSPPRSARIRQTDSMPRLPTQPKSKPGAPIIPLRSGFFALPFSSSASPSSDNLYIFARLHHAEESDASNQLFVTSLPLGTTSVALTKVFSALYPSNPPTSVLLLPSLSQPTLHSSAAAPPAPIDPLFPAPNPSHSPSAILTFSSPP